MVFHANYPAFSRYKISKRFTLFTLLLLTCVAIIHKPITAQAQTSSAVAVFGGGAVLKDVISQLQTSLFNSIQNTEISADRQIQHAANEALITLKEMEIAFGDQLDKTLSEVDAQVLSVVEAVNNIDQSIQRGEADLIYAIDGALLDVEQIVGSTIFAKYPFLLKRVRGLSHLYNNEGEYTIGLSGSGFGASSVTLKQISIDGQELLQEAHISKSERHEMRVSFDVDKLNPLFDNNEKLEERKIKILPVDLVFERVTPRRYWPTDKVEKIEYQFFIYLLPNYAGKLKLEYLGEKFEWQPVENLTFTHRSAHNHCNEDCDDQKSFPCGTKRCPSYQEKCVTQSVNTPLTEGAERLVSASSSGDMSYHSDSSAKIIKDGSCLHFSVKSGTYSHSFVVTAAQERYLKQPEVVNMGGVEIPVEFGKIYTIKVPIGTIVTNYEIDVIGSTKPDSNEMKKGINNSILRVMSVNDLAGITVYNVKIKYPKLSYIN